MNHEESMYWRSGLSDEPLEEEREAMNLKHIPLRRTTDELLILQARARRERIVAFCIFVGAVCGVLALSVWISLR